MNSAVAMDAAPHVDANIDSGGRLDGAVPDQLPDQMPLPRTVADGLAIEPEARVVAAFSDRRGPSEWRWADDDPPRVTVHVAATSRQDPSWLFSPIMMLAEAGVANAGGSLDRGRASFDLVAHVIRPRDVNPDPVETAAGFARGGFNPRDGLIRIVVITAGEEHFIDVDGDGVYTPGTDRFDPADDLPEPFCDSNDDGVPDPWEQWYDMDDDGLQTPANGVWDGDTDVWSSTTVLWVGDLFHCSLDRWREHPECVCADAPTGPPCSEHLHPALRTGRPLRVECLAGCVDPSGPCEGADFEVARGQVGAFTLRGAFSDINGNCLGARLPNGVAPTWRLVGVDAHVELLGGAEGRLDERCFSGEAQPLNQPFETALRVLPPAEIGLDLEPGVRITYTTVDEPFAQHVEKVRVCVAPPSAP